MTLLLVASLTLRCARASRRSTGLRMRCATARWSRGRQAANALGLKTGTMNDGEAKSEQGNLKLSILEWSSPMAPIWVPQTARTLNFSSGMQEIVPTYKCFGHILASLLAKSQCRHRDSVVYIIESYLRLFLTFLRIVSIFLACFAFACIPIVFLHFLAYKRVYK